MSGSSAFFLNTFWSSIGLSPGSFSIFGTITGQNWIGSSATIPIPTVAFFFFFFFFSCPFSYSSSFLFVEKRKNCCVFECFSSIVCIVSSIWIVFSSFLFLLFSLLISFSDCSVSENSSNCSDSWCSEFYLFFTDCRYHDCCWFSWSCEGQRASECSVRMSS